MANTSDKAAQDATTAEDTTPQDEIVTETANTDDASDNNTEADKTYDQKYVTNLRREAQRKSNEITTLKAQITALEAAKNDEIEAIRHEHRLEKTKSAAVTALGDAGVVDPDLAYSLVADQLEFDGDSPKNLADTVKAFVKDHPKMVASPAPLPDVRPTAPHAVPADTDTKMSPMQRMKMGFGKF